MQTGTQKKNDKPKNDIESTSLKREIRENNGVFEIWIHKESIPSIEKLNDDYSKINIELFCLQTLKSLLESHTESAEKVLRTIGTTIVSNVKVRTVDLVNNIIETTRTRLDEISGTKDEITKLQMERNTNGNE